nr:hypothetical protein [Tanacetum cinerariifolium]
MGKRGREWLNGAGSGEVEDTSVAGNKGMNSAGLNVGGERFGGNDATKKTQRNLLKQQSENFFGSSFKSLDQTFDKLQMLVSQLEILGEVISQKDINHKILRSLPSEWGMHVVVWRNKLDLDTLSMDDLYNNLKIYDSEVKGILSNTNTQNMAFVSSSSNNSNSSNGVNTAQVVNTANKVNTASSQAPKGQDNRSGDVTRKIMLVETPNSSALVSCDGLGCYDWSDQAKEATTNYALMSYSTPSALFSDSERLGYNAVLPPHRGLFPPPKSDLSSTRLEEFFNEPKTKKSKDKSNQVEPKSVRENSNAPIIENWVSDDEEEEVEKQEVKPSINMINFIKATTNNNTREHLQDKKVIDSGCSRHMTWNMSFLTDYEEINRVYVAFGGNPKGGKITCK